MTRVIADDLVAPMLGSDPRLAIFTTVGVVRQRKPIVRVSHDHDGYWQFFAADDTNDTRFAMLISAREILEIDPTLHEIASLPPGYTATRSKPGGEWHISPKSDD